MKQVDPVKNDKNKNLAIREYFTLIKNEVTTIPSDQNLCIKPPNFPKEYSPMEYKWCRTVPLNSKHTKVHKKETKVK